MLFLPLLVLVTIFFAVISVCIMLHQRVRGRLAVVSVGTFVRQFVAQTIHRLLHCHKMLLSLSLLRFVLPPPMFVISILLLRASSSIPPSPLNATMVMRSTPIRTVMMEPSMNPLNLFSSLVPLLRLALRTSPQVSISVIVLLLGVNGYPYMTQLLLPHLTLPSTTHSSLSPCRSHPSSIGSSPLSVFHGNLMFSRSTLNLLRISTNQSKLPLLPLLCCSLSSP